MSNEAQTSPLWAMMHPAKGPMYIKNKDPYLHLRTKHHDAQHSYRPAEDSGKLVTLAEISSAFRLITEGRRKLDQGSRRELDELHW
jgi:hypothetical protein